MKSRRRERERRPARRMPRLSPRPRILCVCEGQNTEPQYLRSFIAHFKNPRVELEIVPGPGVPRTLVEKAKHLKLSAENEARRHRDMNLGHESRF